MENSISCTEKLEHNLPSPIVCISKDIILVLICYPNGKKRLGDTARANASTSHKGEGAVASHCILASIYHNSAPHSLD